MQMGILKKGKLEKDLYWFVTDGAFSLSGYYASSSPNKIKELSPLLDLTTPGGIVFDGWSLIFEHGNGSDLLISKKKPTEGKYLKTIGFDTMGMWHNHWKPDEVAYACQEGYRLAKQIQDKELDEYNIKYKRNGKYLLIDNIYLDWVNKEQASTFHIFDNLIRSQERIASLLNGSRKSALKIKPEDLEFLKKDREINGKD